MNFSTNKKVRLAEAISATPPVNAASLHPRKQHRVTTQSPTIHRKNSGAENHAWPRNKIHNRMQYKSNHKWGFLRETQKSAIKAGIDEATGIHRTALSDYLSVIFPDTTDWIHDKQIGEINGKKLTIRPDFRSESLKLIIEFDGLQHYNNPVNIIKDEQYTSEYVNGGYKVVRIPYFIQITNEVVRTMFNVEVAEKLFDPNVPSMSIAGKNTPAFLCVEGVRRMAKELKMYPSQLEVNVSALKNEYNPNATVDLSGYSALKDMLNKA